MRALGDRPGFSDISSPLQNYRPGVGKMFLRIMQSKPRHDRQKATYSILSPFVVFCRLHKGTFQGILYVAFLLVLGGTP